MAVGCFLFSICFLSWRQIRTVFFAAAVFCLILCGINVLFDPRGDTILLKITWPIERAFTAEAFEIGLQQAAKLLGVFALGSATPFYLPADQIARILSLVLPKVGTILLVTLSILPRLTRNAERVFLVWNFRFGGAPDWNLRTALEPNFWLALFDRTLTEAHETAIALRSRGFALQPRTNAFPVAFSLIDSFFLLSIAAGLTLFLLVFLRGHSSPAEGLFLFFLLLPSIPNLHRYLALKF